MFNISHVACLVDGRWSIRYGDVMRRVGASLLLLSGVLVVGAAIAIGVAIASVRNVTALDLDQHRASALPTQVLDRHGRLITQFFAEEKREPVAIDELPPT